MSVAGCPADTCGPIPHGPGMPLRWVGAASVGVGGGGWQPFPTGCLGARRALSGQGREQQEGSAGRKVESGLVSLS